VDLYLAFGGFLIVAFLWAFVIFGVMRNGFRVKRKSLILILFFFIALAAIVMVMGAVIEYMDSPEFCGNTCHPRADLIVHDAPMEPFLEGYENPNNNSIMSTHADNEVTCANCHDEPGLGGKVKAYVRAIPEMFNYVTGNYDPDDLGGHVKNENCLKCHDGEFALKPGIVLTFNNTEIDPHDDDQNCAECHVPHQIGIGLTQEACSVCHAVDEVQLEKHGDTTDQDCMKCHIKEHPENAYIPFNEQPDIINKEFCSDCHQSEFDFISTWPAEKTSFYDDGNCTTACHTEHRESEVPHLAIAPYEDNCVLCHTEDVHFISEIKFMNFTSEAKLENEFCSDCHEDVYNTYTQYNTGECTSCHTEHETKPIPSHTTDSPYDQCSNCHTGITTKHDVTIVKYSEFPASDISNDFCSDCHRGESNSHQLKNHSKYDCVDCHGEHEIAKVVNFDDCRNCHMDDIPLSHNEDRTDCTNLGCHATDAISDKIH
jgi:cytochrome c nitrite reductase small subunit